MFVGREPANSSKKHPDLDSNAGPSCCEVTVLTTAPLCDPCCPPVCHYFIISVGSIVKNAAYWPQTWIKIKCWQDNVHIHINKEQNPRIKQQSTLGFQATVSFAEYNRWSWSWFLTQGHIPTGQQVTNTTVTPTPSGSWEVIEDRDWR